MENLKNVKRYHSQSLLEVIDGKTFLSDENWSDHAITYPLPEDISEDEESDFIYFHKLLRSTLAEEEKSRFTNDQVKSLVLMLRTLQKADSNDIENWHTYFDENKQVYELIDFEETFYTYQNHPNKEDWEEYQLLSKMTNIVRFLSHNPEEENYYQIEYIDKDFDPTFSEILDMAKLKDSEALLRLRVQFTNWYLCKY